MLRYVSGPTSAGPDAYAVAGPRRGVADELVWESLCYSTPVGYRPLFLDLHVPRPWPDGVEGPSPLVVWLHGGGWESGSRRRFPMAFDEHWFLQRVLLAGFAVAVVDYRLCAEADFPAPVDDVRSALSWLRDHAEDFGYDDARVALWGESAGGHLALLGAAGAGTPGVAAVVDWYAPTDLPTLLAATGSAEDEGGEPALSPGSQQVMREGGWGVDAASPVRTLDAGTPPVFIAHGRDDAMVPIAQSELLRDHLSGLGVPVEYHETEGGHVFEGSDVLPDVIARSLEFLGRTLGLDLGPRRDPEPARAATGPAPGSATNTDAGGHHALRVHRPAEHPDTVVLHLPDGQAGNGLDTAVRWVQEHLEELDGSRVVLSGEGLGGSLALATALHCRDGGIPVAALSISCPAVATRELTADLGGLCPVVLGVGAHDPHFEDTLRLAYRLKEAAVPTRFRIFPTLGRPDGPGAPMSAAAARATEQLRRDLGQLLWDGTLG